MKNEELKTLMSELRSEMRGLLDCLLALPVVLFALFFLGVTMPFWIIPYAIGKWRWRK